MTHITAPPMKARFQNSQPHAQHRYFDILKWKLGIGPHENPQFSDAPNHPAAWQRVSREQIAKPPVHGWRAVWLGHASFLLQGNAISLLVDPVFSDFCGPLPIPLLRRKAPPPCAIDDLPPIDAVLLTHSHYDHLDLPTLRRLGSGTPVFVPEGHAAWFRRRGFNNVTELSWFSSAALASGIRVRATPAQHFTARTLSDRNRGHWCGWLIESKNTKLWHAGDSGFCNAFREIGEHCGPIDFGMIPIGAYQPHHIMHPMHMNPEEAVSAFLHTRCRRAAAMHWGTFRLSDEPMAEPPIWLDRALHQSQIPPKTFTCGKIGEIWEIDAH